MHLKVSAVRHIPKHKCDRQSLVPVRLAARAVQRRQCYRKSRTRACHRWRAYTAKTSNAVPIPFCKRRFGSPIRYASTMPALHRTIPCIGFAGVGKNSTLPIENERTMKTLRESA